MSRPRAGPWAGGRVIAHRGWSAVAPENTLAAYRRAAALGVMIELDVALTRDGAVVCIHDATLDRTTSGSGPVAEATLDAIRGLDAGAWFPGFAGERVPRLDEVLAEIDAVVDIELKPPPPVSGLDSASSASLRSAPGRSLREPSRPRPPPPVLGLDSASSAPYRERLVAGVVEAIRGADALDRVFVSSFDPFLLEQARRVEPALRRAQLVGSLRGTQLIWYQRALLQNLAFERRARSDALIAGDDFVTRRWIERRRDQGYAVMVFTVNDTARVRELASQGADAVITDHPDRALQALIG